MSRKRSNGDDDGLLALLGRDEDCDWGKKQLDRVEVRAGGRGSLTDLGQQR